MFCVAEISELALLRRAVWNVCQTSAAQTPQHIHSFTAPYHIIRHIGRSKLNNLYNLAAFCGFPLNFSRCISDGNLNISSYVQVLLTSAQQKNSFYALGVSQEMGLLVNKGETN